MSTLVRLSGSIAARPAAIAANRAFYYATNQGKVYRSTGTDWIERLEHPDEDDVVGRISALLVNRPAAAKFIGWIFHDLGNGDQYEAFPTGWYKLPAGFTDESDPVAVGEIDAHLADFNNPHETTYTQTGGASAAQGALADSALQSFMETDPVASPALATHAARTDNPHSVTKAQVGLGSADNTSDANKPVSTAQAAADAAVQAYAIQRANHTGSQAISTVTSLQGTLDAKADLVGGVVPTAQIPAIAITDYLGSAASEAAMLALTGQKGDWATRSDLGTTWVISGNDPTQLSSWTQLSYPANAVTSVNGQVGVVVLGYADVGAASVTHAASHQNGSDQVTQLYDNSQLLSLDAAARQLYGADGTTVMVNWGASLFDLYFFNGGAIYIDSENSNLLTLDFPATQTDTIRPYGSGYNLANIDVLNRKLYSSDGTTVALDWSTPSYVSLFDGNYALNSDGITSFSCVALYDSSINSRFRYSEDNSAWQPTADKKVGSNDGLTYFDNTGYHGDGSGLTGITASQVSNAASIGLAAGLAIALG